MKKVVGILFFKDRKLLIVKPRKKNNYQMVGGSVENETTYDAAVRESHEELGKEAIFNPNNIKPLMELEELQYIDNQPINIKFYIYIYEGTLKGNLLTGDEIEVFKWFSTKDKNIILSNILMNQIIPYALENNLII